MMLPSFSQDVENDVSLREEEMSCLRRPVEVSSPNKR